MRRSSAVVALLLGVGLTWSTAAPAAAHPLGNATVNHYDGLELHPDRVVDRAVEDIAEIPTFQRRHDVDTDRNGTLTAAETSAYAAQRCRAMSQGVRLTVAGDPVALTVDSASYAERPGAGGLPAARLECTLSGPADLSRRTDLGVTSTWDDDGIGWHEITATGVGVSLQGSPFPATSISQELRRYPNDLLSSPLDVRSGRLTVLPGAGRSTYEAVKDLPVAGPVARALDSLSRSFGTTASSHDLTLGVGLLALLLSLALGAGHAFLPGHGKTIMAAYLVGRRGTLRDVVTVGATVTVTHTAGVLVLGLLVTSTTAFAPAAAERYLGVLSGGIVALVGLGLLVTAVRRLARARSRTLAPQAVLVGSGGLAELADHEHEDGHDHPHDHGHDHPHDHDHGHDHGHGTHRHGLRGHRHGPGHDEPGFGRGGLVGLGVAGGLVPSPSALLVLLAATALGRTWFGVTLVLGYGVGMALALCAAGLLLVKLRSRIDRWSSSRAFSGAGRLLAVLPVLTALLVLAVGTGLALRAAGGSV